MFIFQKVNNPTWKDKLAPRSQGVFHPSEGLHPDSGLCVRKVMFDLLCADRSATDIPARLGKIFENGSDRHAGIQTSFETMAAHKLFGITFAQREVRAVHPTLPLEGSADLVIGTSEGGRYVIDIKTINAKSYLELRKVDATHKLQLTTYGGILGIDTGYMWYENKNTQDWAGPSEAFKVMVDRRLYAEVEDFCRHILSELAHKRMPAFDEKTCSDNKLFCAYQGVCQKERAGQNFMEFDRRTDALKKRHLPILPRGA